MSDEEKIELGAKDLKESTNSDIQKASLFEFGKENTILNKSKRTLAKLSWFQRLFR